MIRLKPKLSKKEQKEKNIFFVSAFCFKGTSKIESDTLIFVTFISENLMSTTSKNKLPYLHVTS